MLNENIKAIRRSKGFSQEELAVRLNVVRQTISKWEQGLSVPDSDMLLSISEALETPVSILLGETVVEPEVDDLKAISKKLEIINLQLAQRKTTRMKILHWLLISVCVTIVTIFALSIHLISLRMKILHWLLILLCMAIVAIFVVLILLNSPYLGWNYNDPETAVAGVVFHAFEWLFVRLAPLILIGTIAGIFLTRKKD